MPQQIGVPLTKGECGSQQGCPKSYFKSCALENRNSFPLTNKMEIFCLSKLVISGNAVTDPCWEGK